MPARDLRPSNMTQLNSTLPKLVRRLGRHESGSFAMIFALALVPILLLVGGTIDYSMANRFKTKLDAIVDGAALAAVNQQAMSTTEAAAQTTALNTFNAQASTITGVKVSNVSAEVTDIKAERTAIVSYTATMPTTFLGLIRINSMTIKGTATATSGVPIYIDFYLLLDNTPSMGVGATPADVTKMVNNTPDKCAFACHDLSTYPKDYYSLAKKLGVTMRIDVVRSATQQLMDTAAATNVVANQFRVAIYTFGFSASSAGLTKIYPLSSGLSGAKTNAAKIDLMTVPFQNYNNDQQTDYDKILPAMNKEISAPGDGSSSSPQKVLFFVSDGVADEPNPGSCSQPTTGGRCQEPIDVSLCTTIKNRGIKIAVLYTTYLPLPTNAWYNTWIEPFQNKIGPSMQSCASPGLYFEVSPTDGIAQAMSELFQKAVAQAHLAK